MADQEIISRRQVWLDDSGKEGGPASGGVLGLGAVNTKLHEFITYANGQIWVRRQEKGQWSEPEYLETDPQLASLFKFEVGQQKEPTATSQWSIQTLKDGAKVRVNELTGEVAPLAGLEGSGPQPKYYETDEGIVEVTPSGPRDPYQDMEAGAVGIPAQPTTGGARLVYNDPNADIRRKQADADLQYKLRQLALLGAPPQRAPRFAEEIELDQLRAEELRQKLARYDEETAWKRAWDQRQEEGLNARQQMSTSANVFGNMGNLWQDAMKWAVPASGIPAGFEADSNYGRLLGSMIPGGYKPPQLTPVAFNPEALWQRAVGMVGGK